ncbi:hypothetical protein LWI28_012578 [Acer negundo]|uniref:Protein LURP-one-related 15 n=1 Tax=Acer negundo TaxID=4023 RepID=A0AAD5I6F7_ACENE|nr:hypothetical protein LWI28_012578 [Acer negundo]
MAQFPAYPPAPNPVSIVGPQYCSPNPVNLAIVRRVMTITNGNFAVQDINDNILFKVKGSLVTIPNRHVLLDVAGKPLVTLQQKVMSVHDRWQVYRGESTDSKDLIFTAKRSSMVQLKIQLHVFLANNTEEDVCDFKVKGSWFKKSCVVNAGESDTIVAQPLDLAIKKQVLNITSGNFEVTDTNGNLVLKVKGLLFPSRRVILDNAGTPIVTLQRKILTAHDRWEVFQGDSIDYDDMIFSAKKSSLIQLKTELDVYLANNINEYVSDFKVKGSWLEQSCTVYAGESNAIVAQMYKKHGFRSILIGKDKFMVTVYPNVDYAFIVALIVILDGITG